MLGQLDLLRPVHVRLRRERLVHHRLADVDQLPAYPRIVDRLPIIARVDDTHHRRQQLRQVGRAAHLVEHAVMLELGAHRNRIGNLARLYPARDRLVYPRMHRIGEMVRGQELAHPVIGAVVGEQRPQQRLLGRQVGRRQPLRQAEEGRIDIRHRAI